MFILVLILFSDIELGIWISLCCVWLSKAIVMDGEGERSQVGWSGGYVGVVAWLFVSSINFVYVALMGYHISNQMDSINTT